MQEIIRLEMRDFNFQYITETCGYQLPKEIYLIVELLDPLKNVVVNLQNVTLLRFNLNNL